MTATDVERQVLARITPGADEQERVHATARKLLAAADKALGLAGLPGQASLQGSIAKDTYLAGDGDFDLFLLMDKGLPLAELEHVAQTIAPHFLSDVRKKYAQHPYVMGMFEGRQVDLVPAYRLAAAADKLSAVDRTPFHTRWVREHLTAALRDDVRLAKRWLKGIGAYGAQTALAGFSGYLVEVLVVHANGFHGVLELLRAAKPPRVALGPDHVKDEGSAWVVVDPVDPTRNCAAAVSADVLALAREAAHDYQRSPTASFYFPPPKAEVAPAELAARMKAANLEWIGWELTAATDRLDIVFPQFQRAGRTLAKALEDAGFPVVRHEARHGSGQDILLQFILKPTLLPASREHAGPIDDGRPNAVRFREKYASHPLALGPVVKGGDGHLRVDLANPHRTAAHWLAANLASVAFGPHVQACTAKTLHVDPGAAPPAWLPAITALALDQRPWRT